MEAGEEPTWELHDGVAVLAHMYKGLVLDQFGVLHNGTQVRILLSPSPALNPVSIMEAAVCCGCERVGRRTQALPGAVQAVAALHERGVRMVINSNSPQNEETTLARLGAVPPPTTEPESFRVWPPPRKQTQGTSKIGS
jgi:hypothetical protein